MFKKFTYLERGKLYLGLFPHLQSDMLPDAPDTVPDTVPDDFEPSDSHPPEPPDDDAPAIPVEVSE